MTNTPTIHQVLTSRFAELRDNTIVLDNSELLNFHGIADGILIVFASWSGQATINCIRTIQTLCDQNYSGQIIVIDIDCMKANFQLNLFGQVCQGWGEIFTIRNGNIKKKYFGKDSFEKYKSDNK